MDRQIKFRGLRKDRLCKGFVIGSLITEPNNRYFIDWFENGLRRTTEVTPSSIGQFTGLTDKNGVEIYEGDRLKTDTEDSIIITWRKDLASFALSRNGWMYDHYFGEAIDSAYCEIIGNIHEEGENNG